MGGGKTFWGLSALLIMCEIFPKSRWCVVREDLEKIRITTIPSFTKLNPCGRLKSAPYEYTHHNGSIIMFKGENYDKDKELNWMRGLEVNGFLFEEITECHQESLDIAFGRAGRWECTPRPKPVILATCNPSNNWIKDVVFDRWKEGTLPEKWLYIQSKVTDNPHLTQAYLENLKNMPRYKYEVFVEGNWDLQLKVGGEFYKCFEINDHVAEVTYDPKLPLHISFDDNVNPYLPCGIFQIKDIVEEINGKKEKVGTALCMIDEIAGITPNNTVRTVCQEFCRRYPGHTAGLFVYGDATANKEDTKMEKGYNFFRLILDHLKQYRPTSRVLRANPSVVQRGNWINTVFEKAPGGLRFIIAPNCKKAIADFVLLKEAADGTKLKEMETDPKTKVRYQKVGHFSDLFDYIAVSAFALEFAKWQAGGNTGGISYGKNNRSKHSY